MAVTSGGVVMGDDEGAEEGKEGEKEGEREEKWVPRLGRHAPESVCGYVLTKHLITVDPKVNRGVCVRGSRWVGGWKVVGGRETRPTLD